jgi:hypothetical protein
MVAETVAVTATETEMEGMEEAAHGMTTHERGSTKAMATKRILANCGDTRVQRGIIRFVLRWVSRYSVFLPFINRGKRFSMQFPPR